MHDESMYVLDYQDTIPERFSNEELDQDDDASILNIINQNKVGDANSNI